MDGIIVGSRINDVNLARSLFTQIRNEYEKIGLVRERIAGLVDGNRPFNTQDLNREGLGWFPNINTREAESAIRVQSAGLWELEMEVPSLITLEIKDSELLDKNLPFNNWINVIENEYTRLVKSWSGYDLNKIMGIREKLLFGITAYYWDDDYDWRFKALKASNIYVPSDAEADISRLDLFFIWHSYRLYELMDIIEDGEGAEANGWDLSVLKSVVKEMVHQNLTDEEKYRLSSYEAIHQAYKDNALSSSYVSVGVLPVVDLFVRERSDKWSRYRFTSDKIRNTKDNFLMVQFEKWDDLNNVICFDLYEVGDNTLRSVKGLGHKIYTMMDINNRITSTILGNRC